MKPLSVEMACLLGIQNEIQAVSRVKSKISTLTKLKKFSLAAQSTQNCKSILEIWLRCISWEIVTLVPDTQ